MSRCLWIWILFRWRDLPTYRSRSSLWSTVDRMQFLYCTHHYSDPFKYIILRRSFDHTYVTFLLTRPSTIIFNESLGYILSFTSKRFFRPGYVYDESQDLRLRCQDVCNMGFCSDGFVCHQTEDGAICLDPNSVSDASTVIQLSLGLMLLFLL